MMNRRNLLHAGLGATAAGILGALPITAEPADESENQSEGKVKPIQERICLFTDHLDDFNFSYKEIAGMLRQLGVAGPDLTVRSGGVVNPEVVAEELPQAAAAFQDEGLTIPMISTGITQARQAVAKPTLTTMSQLGIRYYKLGYYHYDDVTHWKSELKSAQDQVAELVKIGKPLGVIAGIHNHAGDTVGGALWDLSQLLQPLDGHFVGSYFDPAHATIEGANFAWKLNFQRLSPHLKMIAVKDFVWEKTGEGWRTRWCPLGEGMVRWPEFFAMLRHVPFSGPVSLHIEYDVPGKTRLDRFENSLTAAERDLTFLKRRIDEAFVQQAP